MKRINYTLLALMLLLGVTSIAQEKKIEFTEYDLDNGLHVILHKNNKTPIVAVTVMYHVGSKNENPNRTGFAHFFEHLLFEGSQNIDRGEFDSYVENAGGTLNANTSQDRTFYYELLPSNQLELGIWLESERMLHAKVEQVGIETQREVVKEEKRQRNDNQPYGSLLNESFSHAFKEHPYKWTPIGSMEHLDAAQEADYKHFYGTFYVPHNATLSIAGDINIEETKKLIDKYFGSIPRGANINVYRDVESLSADDFVNKYFKDAKDSKKEEVKKALGEKSPSDILKKYFKGNDKKLPEIPRPDSNMEPALGGEVRDTIYDNIQLPAVVMGYRMPAQGTKDFYAVQMMNRILSRGESSRFTKNIVDKKQLAIAALAFPLPLEDPGLALVLGITNAGVQPENLEEAMNKEIEIMRTEMVSDREYKKAQNQIENDFVYNFASVAGIAESLANYHVYFGDANLINTEIDKYMAVTKEDIQNAAKKYLSKDNRVVLYYLPKEGDSEE